MVVRDASLLAALVSLVWYPTWISRLKPPKPYTSKGEPLMNVLGPNRLLLDSCPTNTFGRADSMGHHVYIFTNNRNSVQKDC